MKRFARPLSILMLALLPLAGWSQTTVTLGASRDTALFSEGSLSNGAGPHLYVGNTANDTRRSLLAFNLASIPAGATINSATLTLNQSAAAPGLTSESLSLHRVNGAWGEGASDAGVPGGMGATALPGDATWIFRILNDAPWNNPGGDFSATPSSTATVFSLGGPYDWTGLESDVQAWVNGSANNGWILIGDEGGIRTALRFDSRENVNATNRPQLTVTFTAPVGTPGGGIVASVPTLSLPGLAALTLVLLLLAGRHLRRGLARRR